MRKGAETIRLDRIRRGGSQSLTSRKNIRGLGLVHVPLTARGAARTLLGEWTVPRR